MSAKFPARLGDGMSDYYAARRAASRAMYPRTESAAPEGPRATESVNPRKAAAGPCGVCERPDVAHRCPSCGWMRA